MRGIRNKVIQAYIKFRFPGCRIDWVSPDLAVLTGVNGLRCWVILDKRKTWSWYLVSVQEKNCSVYPALVSCTGLMIYTKQIQIAITSSHTINN